MTIEKKLFLGFSISVGAIIILALISFTQLASLRSDLHLINNDRFPKTVWANGIIDELNLQARAIRNMLIMDKKEDIQKEYDLIKESRKNIQTHFDNLTKTITTPNGIELLATVQAKRSLFIPLMDDVIKLVLDSKKAEAQALLLDKVRPAQLEYMGKVSDIITYQVKLMSDAGESAEFRFIISLIVMGGFSIVAIMVSYYLGRKISKQITVPLAKTTDIATTLSEGAILEVPEDYLKREDEIGILARAFAKLVESTKGKIIVAQTIADGDLSRDVTLASSKDELGIAFKEMNRSLNNLLKTCLDSSEQVNSGAGQVAMASQTLSQGATETASALEEISSSMNEVGAQTKKNAENANQASSLASEAKNMAISGNSQMKKMVEAMNGINTSSLNISKIIKVIDEIAFQTNLLALNAAVEAARAGKHGKGFAVVADEVRKLAERTARATQEIGGMIGVIREETQRAVEGMRAGAQQVAEGVNLVNEAEQSLREINDEMGRTMQIVAEITHASDEQQQAMTELAQNVERVANMTEQNVAVVDQSAATVEYLKSVVTRMRKAVTQYRL